MLRAVLTPNIFHSNLPCAHTALHTPPTARDLSPEKLKWIRDGTSVVFHAQSQRLDDPRFVTHPYARHSILSFRMTMRKPRCFALLSIGFHFCLVASFAPRSFYDTSYVRGKSFVAPFLPKSNQWHSPKTHSTAHQDRHRQFHSNAFGFMATYKNGIRQSPIASKTQFLGEKFGSPSWLITNIFQTNIAKACRSCTMWSNSRRGSCVTLSFATIPKTFGRPAWTVSV